MVVRRTSSRKKKKVQQTVEQEVQQPPSPPAPAVAATADPTSTPRRRSSRRSSRSHAEADPTGAMSIDAQLHMDAVDEEAPEIKPRMPLSISTHALAPSSSAHSHPPRTRLSSYRAMLLWTTLALATLSFFYFTLAPAHSNSCWIVRSPRGVRAELLRAEDEFRNATILNMEPPAVEALASSPEKGRARRPHWFFRHQTLIMIVLLLACLLIKLLHAWLYIRVPVDHAAVTAGSSPLVATGSGDFLTLSVPSSSNPSPTMSGRRVGSTPKVPSRTLAVPGSLAAGAAAHGGSGGNLAALHGLTPPPQLRGLTPPAQQRNLQQQQPPSAGAVFPFHWWEAYRILYCYLFYLSAYFLCGALKSLLGDRSCSDHGNSVSGHYLFFTFAMMVLGYMHLAQKRMVDAPVLRRAFWRRLLRGGPASSPSRAGAGGSGGGRAARLRGLEYAFLLAYTAFCWVCIQILADTYLFGYHSARQILLGTLLSLTVVLAVTGVLEAVETRVRCWQGYHRAHGHEYGECVLAPPVAGGRGSAGHSRTHSSSNGGVEVLLSPSSSPSPSRQSSGAHSNGNGTTAAAPANPALGIAHIPLVSTLLHEWFHVDERAARFYRFPFVVLASFQLVSWAAMLCAPEARFSWRDVAAVVAGHAILAAIVHFKLRLPKTSK